MIAEQLQELGLCRSLRQQTDSFHSVNWFQALILVPLFIMVIIIGQDTSWVPDNTPIVPLDA